MSYIIGYVAKSLSTEEWLAVDKSNDFPWWSITFEQAKVFPTMEEAESCAEKVRRSSSIHPLIIGNAEKLVTEITGEKA